MAEKWIKKAIKEPGALRKQLGIKEGEKIPVTKLRKKETQLRKQAEGDKELSPGKRKLLKRVVLAQTLRKMNK
tara:strand:+ start:8728 stop:8946 length:219 start_codon:yes stop_codon:yes gene_type:complete